MRTIGCFIKDCGKLFKMCMFCFFNICALSFSNGSWNCFKTTSKPENNLDIYGTKDTSWFSCPLRSKDVNRSANPAITWEIPWVWAKLLSGVIRQSITLGQLQFNDTPCHRKTTQRAVTSITPHSRIYNAHFPVGFNLKCVCQEECNHVPLGMSIG